MVLVCTSFLRVTAVEYIKQFVAGLPDETTRQKGRDAQAYLHLLHAIAYVKNTMPVIQPAISLKGDNVVITWDIPRPDGAVTMTAEFTGNGAYVFTKSSNKALVSSSKNLRDTLDFLL